MHSVIHIIFPVKCRCTATLTSITITVHFKMCECDTTHFNNQRDTSGILGCLSCSVTEVASLAGGYNMFTCK